MEALIKTSKNGAAEDLVYVLNRCALAFDFVGRFGGESYFKVLIDRQVMEVLLDSELGRSRYDVKFSD